MLRPTKHSHPDRTVVFVSLRLLGRLQQKRIDSYDDLCSFAKKTVSGGDILAIPALNFLFLLGLIEYRPKTDTVEFLGPQ